MRDTRQGDLRERAVPMGLELPNSVFERRMGAKQPTHQPESVDRFRKEDVACLIGVGGTEERVAMGTANLLQRADQTHRYRA